MKNILFALLLLSVVGCKKSSDEATPDSKYLVTIKCTDCNVSIAEYNSGEKQIVKGVKTLAFNYVPGTITISAWSNMDKDNATVIFGSGSVHYADLWVFSADITKTATITTQSLPPTR